MVVFGDEMAQTREALKRPMTRPAARVVRGRVNQLERMLFPFPAGGQVGVSGSHWKACWRKRSCKASERSWVSAKSWRLAGSASIACSSAMI